MQEPIIMLPDHLQKTVIATAGRHVNLTVNVCGRPKPVVSWSKVQNDVTLNERYNMENAGDSFALVIDKCNRYDAGQYIVSAQNSSGMAKATVTLKVLG